VDRRVQAEIIRTLERWVELWPRARRTGVQQLLWDVPLEKSHNPCELPVSSLSREWVPSWLKWDPKSLVLILE
jgi:hypothetical protein